MAATLQAQVGLIPYKLPQAVGGSGVAAVDVVVVELTDSDGVSGLGFTYVIGGHGGVVARAAQDQAARFVHAQPPIQPAALWRKIHGSFNRTGLGPNLVALAAIDVAIWDFEAKRRNVPLGVAMGGAPRAVKVYGSGLFTAGQTPDAAAQSAAAHVARGFTAVKPRVKGDRSDAALLAAICRAIPSDIHIMADANEKCDLPSARWLMALAAEHKLLYVEEPLPAAALDGYRALRGSGVAIATGEHLQARGEFLPFIAEALADVIQPDLAMIGGLTPVLELALLADAFNVTVSPHFLPGLFCHVAAAAPSIRWLEDFPLLEPLFDGWPDMHKDGTLAPGAAAGHGLSLKDEFRRQIVR
jgi:L-alanine-DL-glutamate epimerase-like enolase superfamily enzyme